MGIVWLKSRRAAADVTVTMRATRAYLASFGTAGTLLAGAAVLFALASAAVSFHGWPSLEMPRPLIALVHPAAATQATPPAPALHRLIAAARAAGGAVAVGAARPGARSGAPPAPGRPLAEHRHPPGGGHPISRARGPRGLPAGSGKAPSGGRPPALAPPTPAPPAPAPTASAPPASSPASAPPASSPPAPPGSVSSLLGKAVNGLTGKVARTLAGAGHGLGRLLGVGPGRHRALGLIIRPAGGSSPPRAPGLGPGAPVSAGPPVSVGPPVSLGPPVGRPGPPVGLGPPVSAARYQGSGRSGPAGPGRAGRSGGGRPGR